MGDWATYSLDDFVMFSPRAWYGLLAMHNQAWWPLHMGVLVAGAGIAWALLRRLRAALRLTLMFVGAALLFVAAAFHAGPHAGINLAAPVFAYVFAAQGAALILLALLSPAPPQGHSAGLTRLAIGLLVMAILAYPAAAPMAGRPLVQSEWFALAPNPTMLAALALNLLLLGGNIRLRHPLSTAVLLSALPVAWCATAGATAWVLGAPDWWLLPGAALLVVGVVGWHMLRRQQRAVAASVVNE